MILDSILDLIGNTPIKRLKNESKAKIFAKLEMFNPTHSVKDRLVKFLLEDAEKKN